MKKIIAQRIFYVLAISSICDQVLSSSDAFTVGKYDTEIREGVHTFYRRYANAV
jgi:hypothetical protein